MINWAVHVWKAQEHTKLSETKTEMDGQSTGNLHFSGIRNDEETTTDRNKSNSCGELRLI